MGGYEIGFFGGQIRLLLNVQLCTLLVRAKNLRSIKYESSSLKKNVSLKHLLKLYPDLCSLSTAGHSELHISLYSFICDNPAS